jgi:hypothetical protein
MNEFSNNAKFALVIAEPTKPLPGVDAVRKWKEFLYNIQTNLRPSEAILKIHENVWLIPLDTEMRFLTQLFDWAYGVEIRLRILFLDAEPNWIKYPPDAEAKPSQATP